MGIVTRVSVAGIISDDTGIVTRLSGAGIITDDIGIESLQQQRENNETCKSCVPRLYSIENQVEKILNMKKVSQK
jgi:hypothetical protein